MGSEFRSIVQPRNYNLSKLSEIISNAKRRMGRYERYNLFNKGIILKIVFFSEIIFLHAYLYKGVDILIIFY